MTLNAEMTDVGVLGARGTFDHATISSMSPSMKFPTDHDLNNFSFLSKTSSKALPATFPPLSTSLSSSSSSSSSSSIPSSVFITQIINLTFFVRNSSSEKSLSSSSTLNIKYSSSYSSSLPLSTRTTTTTKPTPKEITTVYPSLFSLRKLKSVRLKSEKRQKVKRNFKSMEDSSTLRLFESINLNVVQYVDPVVLTLGALCNLMVCLVFLGTPLKARPLSHVLTGLGITDFTYVISCAVIYLSKRGNPVYDVPGVCQVTTFTLTVSRSLLAWFVFIAHFDRLHSHFTHGEESRKGRVYNTKFALIIITLMVVAPSVHVLWSYEVHAMYGKSFCLPMRQFITFHVIMRKIHIVASVIIPLALTVGIDLFFFLKLSLHCFCSVKDYDDDEDNTGNLGVYSGYKINDSTFCNDNTVQLPLHDKKSELCEHLLANNNVATSCRQNQNLSTINEISSDNVPPSQVAGADSQYQRQCGNTDSKTMNKDDNREGDDDKFSLIKQTYPYDPKRKVASYILTSTEDCNEKKVNHNRLDVSSKVDIDQNYDKNCINNKLSLNNNKYSDKENSSRSLCTPGKRQSGHNDSTRDGQLSMFTSSIRKSYTQNSMSVFQYQSYNYTSVASNVSRATVIPEDHIFSSDVTSSSLATVIMGLIVCGLVIPSAYVEGNLLFFSSSTTTRPSALSIQRAIFFEWLVLLNSVYKIILFVIFMKSFRQAFVNILARCLPNRNSRSSICSIYSTDNTSDNDDSIV